jgi:siroheme synthase-like protein
MPDGESDRATRPETHREIGDGYPIVVRLAGRRVVVVGGGEVALRKVTGLVQAGADVTVVAPDVVPAIAAVEGVTIARRPYDSSDVDDAWLVVAATDDPAVQQQIFDDGERRGVFVNAVDDPERCSYILPAVARRGPVIVAVSTQGRSPALAAQLRDRLAAELPDDLEAIVDAAAERRRQIHARGASTEDEAWDGLLG